MLAMEQVEGNYDLLFFMLLQLPPKSVFRFRCVSTRWNNIFLHPLFLRSYYSRQEPRPGGGCLLAFNDETDTVRCDKSVPALAAPHISPPMNILRFGRVKNNGELGRFLGSSNGLILCGSHPDTYYVVNPVTGRIVSLPPPTIFCRYRGMALVCEENTRGLSPKYKVVSGADNTLEIYSSETGKWKRSITTLKESQMLPGSVSLIVNGVIHWYGYSTVVVYDSSSEGGENHVQCINLPRKNWWGLGGGISRSSCDDALWYHAHNRDDRTITFWMLPNNGENDRSYRRSTDIPRKEWICMHTIRYDSLFKDAADFLLKHDEKRKGLDDANGNYSKEVALLVPPRKRNIVHLKVDGRIFLFDLESATLDQLVEYAGTPIIGHGRDFAMYYCDCYPYLESLTLSSYAI